MSRKHSEWGYVIIILFVLVFNVFFERFLHAYISPTAMAVALTGTTLFWCPVLIALCKKQGWLR